MNEVIEKIIEKLQDLDEKQLMLLYYIIENIK